MDDWEFDEDSQPEKKPKHGADYSPQLPVRCIMILKLDESIKIIGTTCALVDRVEFERRRSEHVTVSSSLLSGQPLLAPPVPA